MKNKFTKLVLSAALVLAMSLTLSCSSDGSSSPKKTVKKEKISGVSQKGPFVKGGTVTLYELNESYERTGIVFNGAVKSNNGIYEIEVNDYLASPYVEVEATGKYINEITNAVSADNVTLKAIADVTDKDNVNINVFTHLEHDKVLYWLKQGLSFADAKNQALAEVLAELGIASPILKNSDNMILQADSVLLLASVLLQVGRTESALKTLLSTLAGIEAVKDGMAQALAVYGTAKDNILGSTPISPSSSSAGTIRSSSSLVDNSVYDVPVTYGGETYQTIKIGEQIWFKKNLNYQPDSGNYYANTNQGTFYDWATAMGLSSECNSKSCADLINIPHRGVCPEGFHIPTVADWGKLNQYVIENMVGEYRDPVSYLIDDKLNTYGFSVLGVSTQYSASWWNTEEGSGTVYNKSYAYVWEIRASSYKTRVVKSEQHSIRCLKNSSDNTPPIPEKKQLIDTRNNQTQTYKTIKIGRQNWMAENLKYEPQEGTSSCYGNQDSNCVKYGRLYDWATAMNLPSKCNSILSISTSEADCNKNAVHRGLCPSGWHLPSTNEWDELKDYVKFGLGTLADNNGWGTYLADTYGFSALPGGRRNEESFNDVERIGYWWSSGEIQFYGPDKAASQKYGGVDTEMWIDIIEKSNLYSVRCVQD